MSVRRSRPGTPASFNAPSARRVPLGALNKNTAAARQGNVSASKSARRSAREQRDSLSRGSSRSLPDIGASRSSSSESLHRRPRPGQKSQKTMDLQKEAPLRSHPLGGYRPGSVGSADGPRHGTTGALWYARWKENQPDPSYDIDGDGVVSAFDMAVAREFDKDGNGILDREETMILRTALAKKGLAEYSQLPHGPQVASLAAQSKASIVKKTSRQPMEYAPDIEIDPDSKTWHHTMNQLQAKIARATQGNSKMIQPGIYHTEMSAGNIGAPEAVGGRNGIASLIGGTGEINHSEGTQDAYNQETHTWVDRKTGGNHVDPNASMAVGGRDPIMDAYAGEVGYEDRDGVEMKLYDAAHDMFDHMEPAPRSGRRGSRRESVHLIGGRPGKLSGQNSHEGVDPKAIRRLFDQMDIDNSGTLDEGEVELLCATAGKRLTKRQLHDAMRAMDSDGSGEVEFDEFTNWWVHGVMHPPKGSDVFRQLSDKLEAKCKNVRTLFRSFDENADGTVSQHEFRKGITNLGINVTDAEFTELMETLDEDDSNEIEYNEFANSGVMGGKFFAARNAKGYSGVNTQKEVLEKRRVEYREFADSKVDTFWQKFNTDPSHATRAIVLMGGSGSGF